jgi:hypothetical protein
MAHRKNCSEEEAADFLQSLRTQTAERCRGSKTDALSINEDDIILQPCRKSHHEAKESLFVNAGRSTGKHEQQSNLEDLPRKLPSLCFFSLSH